MTVNLNVNESIPKREAFLSSSFFPEKNVICQMAFQQKNEPSYIALLKNRVLFCHHVKEM